MQSATDTETEAETNTSKQQMIHKLIIFINDLCVVVIHTHLKGRVFLSHSTENCHNIKNKVKPFMHHFT